MTRTISVFNSEFDAKWILEAVQQWSSVEVEEIIEGKNHHITLRATDNLGVTMIKRLVSQIEQNWPEEKYAID